MKEGLLHPGILVDPPWARSRVSPLTCEMQFIQSQEHQALIEKMINTVWHQLLEKRPASAYHCVRVATLMQRLVGILKEEGLLLCEIERWAVPAALIHDFGKITDGYMRQFPIGVCLDHRKEDQNKLHTLYGALWLAENGFPAVMIEAVLTHHRNVDGSGHPEYLDTMPTDLGAFVRLCDHLDVMTMAQAIEPDFRQPYVDPCGPELKAKMEELMHRVREGDTVRLVDLVEEYHIPQLIANIERLSETMLPYFGKRYPGKLEDIFLKLVKTLQDELT